MSKSPYSLRVFSRLIALVHFRFRFHCWEDLPSRVGLLHLGQWHLTDWDLSVTSFALEYRSFGRSVFFEGYSLVRVGFSCLIRYFVSDMRCFFLTGRFFDFCGSSCSLCLQIIAPKSNKEEIGFYEEHVIFLQLLPVLLCTLDYLDPFSFNDNVYLIFPVSSKFCWSLTFAQVTNQHSITWVKHRTACFLSRSPLVWNWCPVLFLTISFKAVTDCSTYVTLWWMTTYLTLWWMMIAQLYVRYTVLVICETTERFRFDFHYRYLSL